MLNIPYAGLFHINPSFAKKALINNINRNVDQAKIDFLVNQIKTNKWDETRKNPIVFDNLDNLLDGQHRLRAIIKAKKGVVVNVIFGMPKCIWDYLCEIWNKNEK